ncbi:MAG: hypothetical protein R2795_08730 [Saprospiraceae bacterium]
MTDQLRRLFMRSCRFQQAIRQRRLGYSGRIGLLFVAQGQKELCRLSLDKHISKSDHVAYIREGWGNKAEGSFWKKGTYYWEALIEGEKVGSKYFYIEDAGQEIDFEENPYAEVKSVRLYEGLTMM